MIIIGFLNMLDSTEKRMGIDTPRGRKVVHFVDWQREAVRGFWGKNVEVVSSFSTNPNFIGIEYLDTIQEVK